MSQDPINTWLQFQQRIAESWMESLRDAGSKVSASPFTPPSTPPSPGGSPGGGVFGSSPFQWFSGTPGNPAGNPGASPFQWFPGTPGGGGGGMGGLGFDPMQFTWQFLRGAPVTSQEFDPELWKGFVEQRMDEMRRSWEDILGNLRSVGKQMLSARDFAAWAPPAAYLPPFQFQDWLQPLLDSWREWGGLVARVAPLPGLGLHRNQQESMQESARLWGEMQQAAFDFNAYMAKGVPDVLDRVRERLSEFEPNIEQPLENSRAIYDLCVNCCEEVYARHTVGEDFSRLHGELNNTALRLRKHWLERMDEMLRASGLPDREAIATLQKRQQEIRRELKKLQEQLHTLRAAAAAAAAASEKKPLETKKPLGKPLGTRKPLGKPFETKKPLKTKKPAGNRGRARAGGQAKKKRAPRRGGKAS